MIQILHYLNDPRLRFFLLMGSAGFISSTVWGFMGRLCLQRPQLTTSSHTVRTPGFGERGVADRLSFSLAPTQGSKFLILIIYSPKY